MHPSRTLKSFAVHSCSTIKKLNFPKEQIPRVSCWFSYLPFEYLSNAGRFK